MPPHNIPPYAGIYYISPGNTTDYSGPHWLPRVSLSSVTKLYNTASRTTLTQTFVNHSNVSSIADAKYTFPLYESCAIVSFRCYVGTRLIEGIVKEKEDASIKYQQAVGRFEPAGLLEQHTPDVFGTSLGNIPPGETVKVEIEYIMALSHDAEVDGLRFTIPTGIAPRYGIPPSRLSEVSPTARAISISVEVTMPSNIKSVQSPSHPISVHLGGHTRDATDDTFDPKHALATLPQTYTELGKDFILLVKCTDLSAPSAQLERHESNSKALMVTLVPKFRLPEGTKPEVVFVIDRSGSMGGRMTPLKSSLIVFLKSLPLGVRFNICSFGSTYSFLWNASKPYSEETLREAQSHVDGMEANFGGTEPLPAIRSTIAKRFKVLMLEIMVLTDGQVWNTEELFQYVEGETAKGDVRLFSLGIGHGVSHALIDGLARVGRGFSQLISDETEGMESKVARMLRGALSAHVDNYRLEWEGRPGEEVGRYPVSRPSTLISLFDPNSDTDPPQNFLPPPDFVVPSVLQAPYKLPSLFPFARSTVYVILSEDVSPPSSVCLRGTTPSGDELQLEIAVQSLPRPGQTIHQLAARKILQELEEGTGYLHGGKYGVCRVSQPDRFNEWVKREGVRVGLKYGLASKWTSFLAVIHATEVTEGEPPNAEPQTELDDEETYEFINSDDLNSGASPNAGSSAAYNRSSVPVMMAFAPPPPPLSYPEKSSLYSKLSSGSMEGERRHGKGAGNKYFKKSSFSMASVKDALSPEKAKKGHTAYMKPQIDTSDVTPPSFKDTRMEYSLVSKSPVSSEHGESHDSIRTTPPLSLRWREIPSSDQVTDKDPSTDFPSYSDPFGDPDKNEIALSAASKYSSLQATSETSGWKSVDDEYSTPDISITYSPLSLPPAARLSSDTGEQLLSLRTKALIDMQTFEGSFVLGPALVVVLGIDMLTLETTLEAFWPDEVGLGKERRGRLWATVLAITLLETKLAGERSTWGLVVEKARAWMRGLTEISDTDIKILEDLARETLRPDKITDDDGW